MAAKLGVGKSTLASYERGETEPSASALAAYRDIYGANVIWIITGAGDMFDDPRRMPAMILDNGLLDRLGRAALQVFGDMKRTLPDSRIAGEAALLYNDLVELGVDLRDVEAVEASIPLLQHRLRRRLELAASDPTTDKRLA